METLMKKNSKTRAPYLDNRALALRIHGEGFRVVAEEIGDRLDAVRASRIVEILRESGHGEIDADLVALASKKRPGHLGGPVKPPKDGEVREYIVGVNGRIGLPLGIIGKGPGDKAKVEFSKTGIKVTP
jgi:hypothetical protein